MLTASTACGSSQPYCLHFHLKLSDKVNHSIYVTLIGNRMGGTQLANWGQKASSVQPVLHSLYQMMLHA